MRRQAGGLLFAAVLAAPCLAAQPPERVTLPGTEVRRITSEHNGVAYRIQVALPNGYASGERRYGAVYTLDAEYSFAIARNVIEHLSDRNHLERLIVVSIAYDTPAQYRLDRTRDYTPTHTPEGGYGPEMQKHSGGGPKFRDFLIEELVPFIDRTYRTDRGKRALAGHSYGGLFTTWVMLTTGSTTFNRFIIVSPSLWYDDGMIFEVVKNAQPAGRVYLAAGALENAVMPAGLRRLAGELRKPARAGLAVRHEILEGETHNSIFPSAFSRGLRWVFEGR